LKESSALAAALLAAVLLTAVSSAEESGSLQGRVSDENTGEPVVGACVSVNDLGVESATDIDGRYRISNLAAGEYTVSARREDYEPTMPTTVTVRAVTTTRDFELVRRIESRMPTTLPSITKTAIPEGGPKTSGRLRFATDRVFRRADYDHGYGRQGFSLAGPVPRLSQLRYFLSAEHFNTDDASGYRYRVDAPRGEYTLEGRLSAGLPVGTADRGLRFGIDGHHSAYQWYDYRNDWRYWARGVAAERCRTSKARVSFDLDLVQWFGFHAEAGLLGTSLIKAVRDLNSEQDDTTGISGLLREFGIWKGLSFRGEDWVFRNPEGLTSVEALKQLYRSYSLSGSGDRVYAYSDSHNFRPAYYTADNPYGVAGLFVGEGDERNWHYEAMSRYFVGANLKITPTKRVELSGGLTINLLGSSTYENSLPWDSNPFWYTENASPRTYEGFVSGGLQLGELARAGARLWLSVYDRNGHPSRSFPESLGSEPDTATERLSGGGRVPFGASGCLRFKDMAGLRLAVFQAHRDPAYNTFFADADRAAAELRTRPDVIVDFSELDADRTQGLELDADVDVPLFHVFRVGGDVGVFLRDLHDLAGYRMVRSVPQSYKVFYNVEHAEVKGCRGKLSLGAAVDRYFSVSVEQTVQVASAIGSASEAAPGYRQLRYYHDQDQRYAERSELKFASAGDFPFAPMRGLEAALAYAYGDSLPYTPTDLRGNQTGQTNSARMPSSSSLDARIGKQIVLRGLSLLIYCDVWNLLNSTIITTVHSATGKPDYTGRVITPYEFSASGFLFGDYYYHPARDYNHDGFITRYEQYTSYVRAYTDLNDPPEFYGPPRTIRLGVSVSF